VDLLIQLEKRLLRRVVIRKGKVVPPPRVAILESGPADSTRKEATETWRNKERKNGAATKSRTRDLLITSQLLYHG
jgi:hypothetical protein